MKHFKNLILGMCAILFSIYSCNKDEAEIIEINSSKNITINRIRNVNLSKFLSDFSLTEKNKLNKKEIDEKFDFKNLYLTSPKDKKLSFISAKEINSKIPSISKDINFAININNEIIGLFLQK